MYLISIIVLLLFSFVFITERCTNKGKESDQASNPGSLDMSFNGVGFVVHDSAASGSNHDSGASVTTDSNIKILVAGCSINSSGDFDMVI